MKTSFPEPFNSQYDAHLKRLRLKHYQPKTIEAYARAVRRIGGQFDYQVDAPSEAGLVDYFSALLDTHSWSALKLDVYGLKFFYGQVLDKPWIQLDLAKPRKGQRLPNIVTVQEAKRLVAETRMLGYRVFFFTLYSLGLRLSEGLNLTVADIDADRMRVHVRQGKGDKDRLVPLPQQTLRVLRAFWQVHRHPTFLFPNRKRGLGNAHLAPSPLHPAGVQAALRQAVADCGIKKRSRPTHSATVMPRI